MSQENFFDKFWIPYLEYEALTGFSRRQMEQEVLDLGIKDGEMVANIGINWGESLQVILDRHPNISTLFGVDSSRVMIELSKSVFSKDGLKLKGPSEGLSSQASLFLKSLHDRAKENSNRVNFVYASAEEFYTQGIKVDKIAATMGFHWLTDPNKAFHSMNNSLNLEGKITFSTASARFEINNPEESFTQNPYYLGFFEGFNELVKRKIEGAQIPKKIVSKKSSIRDINETLTKNGFRLEDHREYKFEVPALIIDEVCKAGIKFSYKLDAKDPAVREIVRESLEKTKASFNYGDAPARYEICPIFTVRKMREVN